MEFTLLNPAKIKTIQTNYEIFKIADINQSEPTSIPSQVLFKVLTYQNEVFTDFKVFSDQNKTPHLTNFLEFFQHK